MAHYIFRCWFHFCFGFLSRCVFRVAIIENLNITLRVRSRSCQKDIPSRQFRMFPQKFGTTDGFPPRPWPSFRTCRSAWRGVTTRLSHFCTPNLTLTPADPEEKTLSSADGSQYEITAVVFLLRLDFYVSRREMWLVCKKSTGMLTQTNVTTTSVENIPDHE